MILRRLAAAVSAVVCAWAAVPAAAQESEQGAYAGADLVFVSSVLEYRIAPGGSPVNEVYETAHLRLRAGYRITKMFAVEAQLIGKNDDTEPDPFADSFKMTTGPIVGLYGRINVPLGDQAGVYGMVGLAQVETEYQAMSPAGPANSDKATRLSFGLGIDVKLTERLRASADLMVYRHGDVEYPAYFSSGEPKQNVTALGFGLNYRF